MTKPSFSHNTAIRGIGTDIIEIDRIEETLRIHGLRFLKRVFTEREIAYCSRFRNPAPHFAARFAAKEAVFKSCGSNIHLQIKWKDIEILNNDEGKPEIQLNESIRKKLCIENILLSMSHCRTYATATAIAINCL